VKGGEAKVRKQTAEEDGVSQSDQFKEEADEMLFFSDTLPCPACPFLIP